MKKQSLFVCAFALTLFITYNAFSQAPVTKGGIPVLPAVKSWGVSIDASPFLNYAGNIFNHTDNTAPDFGFTKNYPLSLTALYVKSEKVTYRTNLRLAINTISVDTFVLLGGSNANQLTTTNTYKQSQSNVTLGLGVQHHKGERRFQGIYGYEGVIKLGTAKQSYKYGEALSDSVNPAFGDRVTLIKQGSTIGVGARGFLGVQYFFAPGISVSAEYGWGFLFESQGKGEIREERWDTDNGSGEVKKKTTPLPKNSTFKLDNDTGSGAINLNFYF